MSKTFYDLDQVRSISILDVCAMYGIDVKKMGRSQWCKIRPERTASAKLYTDNPNGYDSFCDFGTHEGGDVIVFASKILNTDWQTALEQLASDFYIQPVNNTEYFNRNELTNSQYSRIGVYGDLTTKNLDIDLERFSPESAQKYADKYNMSVNELRKQHPDFYTHKILMGRALPFVTTLRDSYFLELHNHYSLSKSLGFTKTEITGTFLEECEKLKKELETAEKLLCKAAKGTSLEERLSVRKYDVQADYRAVVAGEISFQVGSVSYNQIKNEARRNDEVLHYRSVPQEDFFTLEETFLKDVPYAAFLKGDNVNLVFRPEQSEVIEKSLEALEVKKQVDKHLASQEAELERKSVEPIIKDTER